MDSELVVAVVSRCGLYALCIGRTDECFDYPRMVGSGSGFGSAFVIDGETRISFCYHLLWCGILVDSDCCCIFHISMFNISNIV